MASYHCTVKAGASAGAAAHDAYIEREGKYGNRSDLEVAESGNLPAWASSSADFWKASDRHERANAKGYQEYEVALPRELPPAARLELVRAFVKQELGERHTYSFAIHTPKAALEGGEQPHAHIMFSDRHLDGIERPIEQHFKRYNAKNPEKGGCRKGEGAMTGEERTAQLLGIRERWGTLQNKHLERHGVTERVNHRSLKDQGVERAPEQHLGPRHIEGKTPFFRAVMAARADRTLMATLNNAIAEAQKDLDKVQTEAAALFVRMPIKPEPQPSRQSIVELANFVLSGHNIQPEIVRQAAAQELKAQRELAEQRKLEMRARAEAEALRKPGLLSLPATKKAYQVELLRIHRYGLDAIAAQKQAKLDLQDAELRKKEPIKFVDEFLVKRDPAHAARMKELGKDPSILQKAKELVVSRLQDTQREAATKDVQVKRMEQSTQQNLESPEQDRDLER